MAVATAISVTPSRISASASALVASRAHAASIAASVSMNATHEARSGLRR